MADLAPLGNLLLGLAVLIGALGAVVLAGLAVLLFAAMGSWALSWFLSAEERF